MENFDINNLVIDHVNKVYMTRPDGAVAFVLPQITDLKLNIETDDATKNDALGTPIATFKRGKKLEMSGESALFDMNLYAAQQGATKNVASAENKIVVPVYETVTASGEAVKLAHKPISAPKYAYKALTDDTLGAQLKLGTVASADTFTYDEKANTVTFDASVKGDYVLTYEFESDKGADITIDGKHFGIKGKAYADVLATSVCDTTLLTHALIELPSAQLDSNAEIGFSTDSNHPFKITANIAYCDKKKTLARVIVLNEDDDEE